MSEQRFYIDIENSSGTKQGSGPIASARSWTYAARMDKAGSFSFEMLATDTQASQVQKKRIARAYALLDGVWIEVGAGIIDHIEKKPQVNGQVMMRVSGDDLIRELTYRSVLNLKLYSGSAAITHSAALTAISAFAPAGWTFTADSAPSNDSIYGYFNGESVLAGICKIAEKSQNHFYRGTGRTVVFASSFTSSGVRAIQADDNLVAETCAIRDITEQIDTYDLITRIYPRGSGNAEVQLTLRATSRAAPTGYTLDSTANYIEATTPTATYGRIERQVDFRDIGPIENTDADIQAAANMLFDSALETLKRQSTELEQATYTLAIDECSVLLRPMQTIRVSYRDVDTALDIEDDLNILEATWQVDASGVRTTALVVSNADRWPPSDASTIVESMGQGQVYQALPQLNANSYTTGYTKNVDDTETASFRFRFGSEVVQLQQVLFEFQLLQFESTVKSIGGATSGSGEIPTGGPSSDTTGSGGNNETGSGGPTSTDSGGPTATGSTAGSTGSSGAGDTGSGGSGSTGSGGAGSSGLSGAGNTSSAGSGDTGSGGSGDTGSTSGGTDNGGAGNTDSGGPTTTGSGGPTATGSTSGETGSGGSGDTGSSGGETGAASGDTGSSGGQEVSSPSSNSTGSPTGGDVVSAGQHLHSIEVSGTTSTRVVTLRNDNSGFAAEGLVGQVFVNTQNSGNHTHSLSDHKHDMANHTHSVGSHTHTLGNHTHTVSNHTHSIGSHTHTVTGHTHSITAHTHSVAAHLHSIGGHVHTIPGHTHTVSNHTHTVSDHDHEVSSHTHTVSAHTHSVSSHTHSIGSHTHTVTAHTHTITAHTHSMSQHTHTLNNHTHDLSEAIVAIYGIFRETLVNTYGIADLEYQVNSGGFADLSGATDIGSGWYRLDITSDVQNATTFRPTQESNTLQIRRKAAAVADKTVTVDALLSVRNTIQAISYV